MSILWVLNTQKPSNYFIFRKQKALGRAIFLKYKDTFLSWKRIVGEAELEQYLIEGVG
jgi:hypothetical protein